PSVNSTRLRSSATANRFLTLSTAIYVFLLSSRGVPPGFPCAAAAHGSQPPRAAVASAPDLDCSDHLVQCYSVSAAPPAAAIFSAAFPLNLCALIVSTFAMS